MMKHYQSLFIVICLIIGACNNPDAETLDKIMNYRGTGTMQKEEQYISTESINRFYLDYNDTLRWVEEKGIADVYYLKRPILKISFNKPIDIKYINEQIDSAISFANAIGPTEVEYELSFTYFADRVLTCNYESFIENYMDTASWLPKADSYLRKHGGLGIDIHAYNITSFIEFDTWGSLNDFVCSEMRDSAAYMIFTFTRINLFTDEDSMSIYNRYPTYGGRKVKSSEWKYRQTKPYPRK